MINLMFYFLVHGLVQLIDKQPMLKTKTTRSHNLNFQHKLFEE